MSTVIAHRATHRCCQCRAPATGWHAALHGQACATCAEAAEQYLVRWRAALCNDIAQQMEHWLATLPNDVLNLLLFSLLDNGMQHVFGIDDHSVNLEEAAARLAAVDPAQRRALLPALLSHRLSDSLIIWQLVAPYLSIDTPTLGDSYSETLKEAL